MKSLANLNHVRFWIACFILLIIACDDENSQEEVCNECVDESIESTFQEQRLFLDFNSDGSVILENDMDWTAWGVYQICPTSHEEMFDTLQSYILYGLFDGAYYTPRCDSSGLNRIKFTDYEKMTGCNQDVDSITDRSFELQGVWAFSYAEVEGDKIEVPCELEYHAVGITDDELGMFSCSHEMLVTNDSLFLKSGVCLLIEDPRVSTVDSRGFGEAVGQVIWASSYDFEVGIHYAIKNNFLILTNREGDELVLFQE